MLANALVASPPASALNRDAPRIAAHFRRAPSATCANRGLISDWRVVGSARRVVIGKPVVSFVKRRQKARHASPSRSEAALSQQAIARLVSSRLVSSGFVSATSGPMCAIKQRAQVFMARVSGLPGVVVVVKREPRLIFQGDSRPLKVGLARFSVSDGALSSCHRVKYSARFGPAKAKLEFSLASARRFFIILLFDRLARAGQAFAQKAAGGQAKRAAREWAASLVEALLPLRNRKGRV